MKKKSIMLLIICMCLLCSCNSEKSITGKVIEVFNNTNSTFTQFIILTEKNEKIGIMINEKTQVWSFLNDFDDEAFKNGKISDVKVFVEYTGHSVSMKTADNRKIKAYIAKDIGIEAVHTKDRLSLSDGTKVDIWEYFNSRVYQLTDGIILLRVMTPSDLNNVIVGELESTNDLSDKAKSNILTFYTDQGLLYDVNNELEKAYAEYQQTEKKADFNAYMLSQEISLTASSDNVMYFLTSVSLPIRGSEYQELRLGAAFDRESGKHISTWELFSCEKNEVIQTILDIAKVTDPVLRAEMEKAFAPENIVLSKNNIEVSFPEGTLPSQENSYTLSFDYNEEISKILNKWAIPNNRE